MVIVDPTAASNRSQPNDAVGNNIMNYTNNITMPFYGSMASAFQGACDEDVRMTLNALANPITKGESLKFYLVPCSWMDACRAYLKGQTEVKPDEKIKNASLLTTEHKISSSSEDEMEEEEELKDEITERDRKRRLRQKKWKERQRRNLALNDSNLLTDLKYGTDYYLVGPSAWMLLSSKFGYDVMLERPVIVTSAGKLAVNLGNSILVNIPPSGRFDCGMTNAVQAAAAKDETDVVSEEEDDHDLFPSVDNSQSQTSEPVFLLPPSTTSQTPGYHSVHNQNGGKKVCIDSTRDKLYPPSQDMEYENDIKPSAAAVVPKKRTYATGLGNLGNTCFMNSTLQCLAHTDPLRRYFLSGEYVADLNRDNPLGTGGELATEFAELLKEMWSHKQSTSTYYNSSYYSSSVVYPRNFKTTLGRHAEQFLGYDQHDSHELATYLLDALHEDTNRVTKKPYIEKPEQGESEPDDVAANKAWEVHLQREDSSVLENFMGQVKSRVQCPVEGCGRVSTTFDPFMYLSVPIPGATDRTLTITFVPLDPEEQCKTLSVTLSKTSSMAALQKKIVEMLQKEKDDDKMEETTLQPQDICLADVWSNEVYTFYKPRDEIDKIRDTDTTYAFQLRSVSSIHEEEPEVDMSWDDGFRYLFDCHTNDVLGDGDWMKVLEKYLVHRTYLYSLFNSSRCSTKERIAFYEKLGRFVEDLHEKENDALTLEEITQDWNDTFQNVQTIEDLGILEECVDKVHSFIEDEFKASREKYNDGITVQIVFKRSSPSQLQGHYHTTGDRTFTRPMALRIPPGMTVYGLRQEIAKRIAACLFTGSRSDVKTATVGFSPMTNESDSPMKTEGSSVVPDDTGPEIDDASDDRSITSHKEKDNTKVVVEDANSGSPAMLIVRQIPLTFDKKSEYSTYKASTVSDKRLGMLDMAGSKEPHDGRPVSLASPKDEEEQKIVCEVVGQGGTVYLHWPYDLSDDYFDIEKYEACYEWKPSNNEAEGMVTRKSAKKVTTVFDCIERFCQMEQLEDSEMWYCNRCKEHVRAWKQFHLYRAPPILIIHLKRFHYSATTHRRDKIDSYIDFPLTDLDLTNEVMQWTEEEKPIYDLYAVSNHFGGLGGGHYTAYALSDDGKWCNFDDSRVASDVDPKEVKSSAAYVLYYRRRDVAPLASGIEGPAIVQPTSEEFASTPNGPLELSSRPVRPLGPMELSSRPARSLDYDLESHESGLSSNATCASPMGSVEEEEGNLYDDDEDERGNYAQVTIAPNDDEDYPLQ